VALAAAAAADAAVVVSVMSVTSVGGPPLCSATQYLNARKEERKEGRS